MSTLNLNKANVREGEIQQDCLRINRSTGNISGLMSVFKFQDRDTKQIICFCPSFDISGYGENETKAFETLKFSVKEYFEHLLKLSPKPMSSELAGMGWKQSKFRHKEFSNSFVDVNGDLHNFNAVDNKVERMTLEAA